MGQCQTPGPTCQENRPQNVDDGTLPLKAGGGRGPVRGPEDVSFEIGACFAPVATGLTGLDGAQLQVLAWLRAHRTEITAAEQKFRVDRRAIAGAIAWEMLENVRRWSPRSVGPGKVHLYNYSKSGALVGGLLGGIPGALAGAVDTNTVARQAEDRGYLPPASYDRRKVLLATPDGAITYIAAIMAAFADIAARQGFEDIRSNPVVLTNAYQSKTLDQWEEHLKSKPARSKFAGGNSMDLWVSAHLDFLEDGVGKPQLAESAPLGAPR